ncbi:type II toxin-antitoxin system RelE/ParE family toxin [Patescibacteria group bacterium]
MTQIAFHRDFLKSAKQLPKFQQVKLSQLLERMQENPFHPLLHTKRLTGEISGLLSFRITRDWRVIFQFIHTDKIQLLRVKHRKDVYR